MRLDLRIQGNLRGWAFGERLASWPYRIGAAAIDYGVTYFLPSFVFENVLHGSDIIAWAILLLNVVLMRGRTTQSLGYRLLGMQLLLPVTTLQQGDILVRPSYLRCFLRQIAHVFDAMPSPPICSGLVLPLIMKHRQTWADKAVRTLVFRPLTPIPVQRRPRFSQTIRRL